MKTRKVRKKEREEKTFFPYTGKKKIFENQKNRVERYMKKN
jgi:hypothetical protein